MDGKKKSTLKEVFGGIVVLSLFVSVLFIGRHTGIVYTTLKLNSTNAVIDSIERYNERVDCMATALVAVYPQDTMKVWKTKKMIVGGLSPCAARSYSFLMRDIADSFHIGWEIMPAVLWIESRFNPTLTSETGPMGIAQTNKATTRTYAKRMNIVYKDGNTVWTDIESMAIGMTHLAEMVSKKGVEGGIRTYLNSTSESYMDIYYEDVARELRKIQYVYMGVVAENERKSTVLDTIVDTSSNCKDLEVIANDSAENSLK